MVNELSERMRPSRSTSRPVVGRWLVGAVAGAVACGALALSPREAAAQDAEPNAVSGTAKGIVGGGLLGAEVVMIPMGAAGLKPWWPYVVFGAVGAAGGAVGGWAVEQANPPAEAPLYMLAGGLALIIPTLVLTLNATTKEHFEESTDPSTLTTTPDTTPTTKPPADGQPPPGTQPTDGTKTIQIQSDARKHIRRFKSARPYIPSSLFGVARNESGSEVRLGVPAFEIRNMYSNDEMAKFGVDQKTEVHIPIFGAAF